VFPTPVGMNRHLLPSPISGTSVPHARGDEPSNVRECFFQAVSNSSWANFGYLVAAEIGGTDTLKELRMLFAAHGIGFIKLDVDNPADSQVLIPARERDEIDWDMANRLATENRDFLEYVKLVKQFYQTGEARLADWDIPPETTD
jgi:hypothetical protein